MHKQTFYKIPKSKNIDGTPLKISKLTSISGITNCDEFFKIYSIDLSKCKFLILSLTFLKKHLIGIYCDLYINALN